MTRVLIQGVDGTEPIDVAVDAYGRLQVDVVTLGELRNALASVGTDALFQIKHFTQAITKYYQAAPGNHGYTERWAYTVPSGRVAFLEALALRIDTSTADETCLIFIDVTRFGGVAFRVVQLFSSGSEKVYFNLGYDLSLAEGDKLTAGTVNGDGTVREFNVNAFIRETTL